MMIEYKIAAALAMLAATLHVACLIATKMFP
jgi:hypothetical protein